ncbi:MAG: hypothetical protein SWH54_18775 [Thermodesulfobacteriota bacterium]|nr:hypothetical protein [Thermodesulfobacteriota bacterium]
MNRECNTVCFYAVNAGALAVMSPLVAGCPDDINCFWAADGFAESELRKSGTVPVAMEEVLKRNSNAPGDPALLVLGSQHQFSKTVSILKACERAGVKTVFIFDHWSPYLDHFMSSDGCLVLPKHIFAIDEYLETSLLSIGVPKDSISIVGHPGIENKTETIKFMSGKKKKALKNVLGVNPDAKVVLLALELMDLKFNADAEYGPVLNTLQAFKEIDDNNLHLVIKMHPHQSRKRFLEYIRHYKIENELIICPEKLRDFEAIAIADIIIGTNSTFLVIPLILGISTICIGFRPENEPRQITIPYLRRITVKTKSEMLNAISECVTRDSGSGIPFPTDSVNKTWKSIRNQLKMV